MLQYVPNYQRLQILCSYFFRYDHSYHPTPMTEVRLITRQKNLQSKLSFIKSKMDSQKDDFVDFGQLGIDHLYIDESQKFKNLTYVTRHSISTPLVANLTGDGPEILAPRMRDGSSWAGVQGL